MADLDKPSGSNLKKSHMLLLLSEGAPEFPLSEQAIASVAHLPGELPTSLTDFWDVLHADSPRPLETMTPAQRVARAKKASAAAVVARKKSAKKTK